MATFFLLFVSFQSIRGCRMLKTTHMILWCFSSTSLECWKQTESHYCHHPRAPQEHYEYESDSFMLLSDRIKFLQQLSRKTPTVPVQLDCAVCREGRAKVSLRPYTTASVGNTCDKQAFIFRLCIFFQIH